MNLGVAWPDDAVVKCDVSVIILSIDASVSRRVESWQSIFIFFSPSGFPAQKVNMLYLVIFAVVATTAIIAITRLQINCYVFSLT